MILFYYLVLVYLWWSWWCKTLKCVMLSLVSRVQLFVTQWTVTRQAPLSMGILQAWILEWVATSYSKGSSLLRDQTHISCIGRGILNHWATKEASVQVREPQNQGFLLVGVREGSLKKNIPHWTSYIEYAVPSLGDRSGDRTTSTEPPACTPSPSETGKLRRLSGGLAQNQDRHWFSPLSAPSPLSQGPFSSKGNHGSFHS